MKEFLKKFLENSDKNIGAFVFSFTDGLWRAGNPNKQDTGGVAFPIAMELHMMVQQMKNIGE